MVRSTSPFCKSFGAKVGIAQAPKGTVTNMDRAVIALYRNSMFFGQVLFCDGKEEWPLFP
ncbi:MAG: hypothetical protein F6K24_06965 [Okeania sp. SIO2D1]|nr:hypothetical protein [Okeania sp. SIO2D1]